MYATVQPISNARLEITIAKLILSSHNTYSLSINWQAKLPWIALSIAAAALLYLALATWAGWADIASGASQIGLIVICQVLGLSLLNYGLRFIRWQGYLNAMKCPIPWFESLRIYVAGFALTTSPGKAGEAIRGVFLAKHGMKASESIAAFFSERVSDLLGVVTIAAIGLFHFAPLRPYILGAIALTVMCFFLLWADGIRKPLVNLVKRIAPPLAKIFDWLESLVAQIRVCHSLTGFISATALSLIAWGAEAYGVHLLLVALSENVELSRAMFIHPAGALAGAASFVPGGIGGTEAVMIYLLKDLGVSPAHAVATTVICRLATLWFAVILGAIAMLSLVRRPTEKK